MSRSPTQALVNYVVDARPEALPEAVRKDAKRTFLNWVGCAVGGSRHETLDVAIAALSPFAGADNKREVRIDWSIEDNLPPICVDRIQTQQVFINLISNAIEATDGRANRAKILLRAFVTQEDEVVVQVIDNGTGLEDTENIFDAFMTTKEKGMGIGLAVSRSIVEAHGGRLWAERNPDHGGATFNVALPISSKR
jgi:signal transduction histidine kinase